MGSRSRAGWGTLCSFLQPEGPAPRVSLWLLPRMHPWCLHPRLPRGKDALGTTPGHRSQFQEHPQIRSIVAPNFASLKPSHY